MLGKSIVGASLLASLTLAPAAHAATIQSSDPDGGMSPPTVTSTVFYIADPLEDNAATFTRSGTSITVTDPNAVITASQSGQTACRISDDGHSATCTDVDGYDSLDARLRDGDDTARSEIADDDGGDAFRTQVLGGGGDDRLTGSDLASDDLSGGAGDDVVDGRGRPDTLSDSDFDAADFASGGTNLMIGGEGTDLFFAGPGDDTMRGGGGNDLFYPSRGTDAVAGDEGSDRYIRGASVNSEVRDGFTFDGGPGDDTVGYFLSRDPDRITDPAPDDKGATVRLDAAGPTTGNGLPGQNDTLVNVEDAQGSAGADTLIGSSVSNRLYGFSGNDTITGGGALDDLAGGRDADTVDAADGRADRVRCSGDVGGDPGDSAKVDDVDDVANCPAAGTTTARVPGPAAPAPQVIRVPEPVVVPPDRTAPAIGATRLPTSIRRSVLLRRGYAFTVRSTDAAPNVAVATLTGRLRGGVRLATVGDVIAAQRTQRFTRTSRFTLRLSGSLRRAVRRGTRLRLLVEVRDAAGNRSARTVRIRVR